MINCLLMWWMNELVAVVVIIIMRVRTNIALAVVVNTVPYSSSEQCLGDNAFLWMAPIDLINYCYYYYWDHHLSKN